MTTTISLIDLNNPTEDSVFHAPLTTHALQIGQIDYLNNILNPERDTNGIYLRFQEIDTQLRNATNPISPDHLTINEMAQLMGIELIRPKQGDFDAFEKLYDEVVNKYEDYLKAKSHVEPIVLKIKDLSILTPEYLDKISAEAIKDCAMNASYNGNILGSNVIPTLVFLQRAVILAKNYPNLAIRIA